MRIFVRKVAAGVAVGFLAVAAYAVPISGDITIVGAATVPAGDDAFTASTIVGFSSTVVVVVDGDYLPLSGASINMHGFTFKPGFVAPVPDLWDVTMGGIAYSFDLQGITSVLQGNSPLPNLHLTGFGMANMTGKDPTPGVWRLDGNGASSMIFGFSSTNAVPDGGVTLLLLGLAVSGFAFFRRKTA